MRAIRAFCDRSKCETLQPVQLNLLPWEPNTHPKNSTPRLSGQSDTMCQTQQMQYTFSRPPIPPNDFKQRGKPKSPARKPRQTNSSRKAKAGENVLVRKTTQRTNRGFALVMITSHPDYASTVRVLPAAQDHSNFADSKTAVIAVQNASTCPRVSCCTSTHIRGHSLCIGDGRSRE